MARLNDLEEIWMDMVEKVESTNIRQFLCQQVKLASFTIASGNIFCPKPNLMTFINYLSLK